MRAIVIVVSAVVVLATAYIGAGSPPLPNNLADLNMAISGEDAVSLGFTGTFEFGAWRLICVPGPQPAPAGSVDTRTVDPRNETQPRNTCRVNQEVTARNDTSHVIMAANLSLVGLQQRPALMLRLPPTARPGDRIVVWLDDSEAVETSVRDCLVDECIAASDLSQAQWRRLIGAQSLQITFPTIDGQTAFVDLAVDGLVEAVAAMVVAQRVSP
ncbi:MAG: invasion associated locus B family protein [Proteobacteria bacterium]|nr:invasion associated locus B family protein [Pseudomonadota bacterium]